MKKVRRSSRKGDEKARDDLRRDLILRWQAFAPSIGQYQWPLERGRWIELVFCLLRRTAAPTLDAVEVRALTRVLDMLRVIEVDGMAPDIGAAGNTGAVAKNAELAIAIMIHSGLSRQQADNSWITIAEAADALRRRHGGKLQRYLRAYGERMLAEIDEHFQFSRLDRAEVTNAFTHWLQNALAMPLLIAGEAVEKTVASYGLKRSDLVRIADELEFNLAVVDDMIESIGAKEGSGS